jgi:hypothetical protein
MKKISIIAVLIFALVSAGAVMGNVFSKDQDNLINDELIPLSSSTDISYNEVNTTLQDVKVTNFETASGSIEVNESLLDQGAIGIKFNYGSNKKIKIVIEKNGEKVHYNYVDLGNYELFPLQFGNGEYKISVLENTTDNRYKVLGTHEAQVDISDENLVFLNSIQTVNWSIEDASSKLAEELTMGLQTDSQKFKAIYEYVVRNIDYDYDKIDGLDYSYIPDNSVTLDEKAGICYDYSALMASMLRSIGIPAKLVKGYGDFQPDVYHAWNEVLLDGKWYVIDATYDAQQLKSGKEVKIVKDDQEYSKVNIY